MRIWLAVVLSLILVASCGRSSAPPAQGPGTIYPSFKDFDPTEWSGRRPESYAIHGIDISRWQDGIDWPRARDAGISFAFIKATEGGDRVDPGFAGHWDGAARAGVRRGAYHFFYFCRPAEEQARWFIQNVPREADALPPVLDMEWNHLSPTCKTRPPAAQVQSEARKFIAILARHYGKRPIIYTTPDFYEQTGIGAVDATFWLRSVADHPTVVYPRQDWAFWQYTGTGEVPGISGKVDINAFRGGPDDWARFVRG
ncbi:glycoside hydrolase family 25 protein [Maribius pontilimi]|uniref:Glycoside hydrolase family 25 protein n=1 Tax=Palleronia pontilimi TaxID=1964209 RepID=A0A934IEZ0_9RHOB|nr:GH25 family lysozyme [Palleronia pontilimi]MBJ3761375.1 glycoside hydrolase family 25 protein [Palleronia pontilimi]